MAVHKMLIPVCKTINIDTERKHVSNMATGCIQVYEFLFGVSIPQLCGGWRHNQIHSLPEIPLTALIPLRGWNLRLEGLDYKYSRPCRPSSKSQWLNSVKPMGQRIYIYMNKWIWLCSHECLWHQHWISSDFYISQNTIVILIFSPQSLKIENCL